MDLEICECDPSDFDEYYNLRCDETDIYWMGYAGKPDKEILHKIFLERIGAVDMNVEGAKKIYFIYKKDLSTSPIGFIQLARFSGKIEFGYAIKKEFQGQGLGTQMIATAEKIAINMTDSLIARIRDDNFASQNVVLKNGFIRTDNYEINNYPNVGKVKFRTYTKNINSKGTTLGNE